MSAFTKGIKNLIKGFIDMASKTEPVEDMDAYYRVKGWVRKATVLYAVFFVIGIVFSVIGIFTVIPASSGASIIPKGVQYVIIPFITLLSFLGYATLILYFKKVTKSVFEWGRAGYRIGENFETTTVEVSHEYDNRYRVTARKENKGCLFAIIGGFIRLCIWVFVCVYIGPFITVKKIVQSRKALAKYKAFAE